METNDSLNKIIKEMFMATCYPGKVAADIAIELWKSSVQDWAGRLAALSGQAAQTAAWRPIETAPRDGTIIMGFRFYPVVMKYVGGEWPWEAIQLDGLMPFLSNGFFENDEQLTHWMPLPAPPASKQSGVLDMGDGTTISGL